MKNIYYLFSNNIKRFLSFLENMFSSQKNNLLTFVSKALRGLFYYDHGTAEHVQLLLSVSKRFINYGRSNYAFGSSLYGAWCIIKIL